MMMHEPLHFTGLRGRLAQRARSRSTRAGARAGRRTRSTCPRIATTSRCSCASSAVFEPVTVLGLGSNTLVRDGGVRGAVIVMHNPGAALAVADGLIYAEAGAASPKLARFAATHGCAEAEFLAGVPGTVGGALAMNAGCYGGETWRYVARVEVLTRDGAFRGAHACRLCDRLSQRAPRRRLAARRDLYRGMVPLSRRATWRRRARAHQGAARASASRRSRCRCPTRAACSAIRRAITRRASSSRAGSRAHAIGDARVSEKHANFIVNPGRRAQGGRHRGADRARARHRCERRPVSTSSPRSESWGRRAMTRTSAKSPCSSAGPRRSARSRSCPATACSRRCAKRASTRTRSIPPSATCGSCARRLRPRVHRAARPLRRGRHGAGRAGDAARFRTPAAASWPRRSRWTSGAPSSSGSRAAFRRRATAWSTRAPTGCASWPSSGCRSS